MIKDLVKDIYGLFEKGFVFKKEDVSEFANNLSTRLTNRLSEERVEGVLRMSNLGDPCRRRLWYKINTPELAEPLSPSTRIKFLFGDILEELLFFLARVAGHKVTREQEEVEINGVKGHLDGFIDDHLVDAKSASTYSFQKFKNHTLSDDDAFGYLGQIGAYATATGEEKASFLAIDKQHGHIVLDTWEVPDTNYAAKIDEIREDLASAEPPPRGFEDQPYGKSGNRALGVNCSYCDFRTTCWPEVRTFAYAKGPVHFTKIVREPRVVED